MKIKLIIILFCLLTSSITTLANEGFQILEDRQIPISWAIGEEDKVTKNIHAWTVRVKAYCEEYCGYDDYPFDPNDPRDYEEYCDSQIDFVGYSRGRGISGIVHRPFGGSSFKYQMFLDGKRVYEHKLCNYEKTSILSYKKEEAKTLVLKQVDWGGFWIIDNVYTTDNLMNDFLTITR